MAKRPDNIEDVLAQLGIRVANVGSTEISASCPFHTDSHPSFSINIKTGLWICYQCSERGTLPMLLDKVSGDVVNADEYLREIKFKNITKANKEKKTVASVTEEEHVEDDDPFILFARYEGFGLPPRWALKDRMLDRATAERYGLKWDRGWVIPIWDPEVEDDKSGLWGWQYKQVDFVSNYPPKVKKSHTLFGLHEHASGTVVLVESPLDVVRLASAGVSSVSSFGAYVSKVQMSLIVAMADRVILALDNDEEGARQTAKVYPYFAKRMPTSLAQFPRGAKDPGDLSDRQVAKVFSDLQKKHNNYCDQGRLRTVQRRAVLVERK